MISRKYEEIKFSANSDFKNCRSNERQQLSVKQNVQTIPEKKQLSNPYLGEKKDL